MSIRRIMAVMLLGFLSWVNPALAEGEQAPVVMRHGYHSYDAPWHLNAGITFIQWLEDATANQIKVENYNNFSIRVNEDLISYIKEDKLDSAVVTLETLAKYNTKFNLFFLPYLFENSELAHKVMDDYLLNWINELLKPHGLVALGILDFGFREICSNRPDLKTLDDLKKLTLATSNRDVYIEALDQIGIKLRRTPFEDLYKVATLGLVDGVEHLISVMVAKQLNRVQKHLYLTNHFYEFMPMVFSQKFLDKLSPQLLETLKDTVTRAQELNRSMCKLNEEEYIQYLADNGMIVHELPYDPSRKEFDQAYESIAKKVGAGDELWQLFYEISKARYALTEKQQAGK